MAAIAFATSCPPALVRIGPGGMEKGGGGREDGGAVAGDNIDIMSCVGMCRVTYEARVEVFLEMVADPVYKEVAKYACRVMHIQVHVHTLVQWQLLTHLDPHRVLLCHPNPLPCLLVLTV